MKDETYKAAIAILDATEVELKRLGVTALVMMKTGDCLYNFYTGDGITVLGMMEMYRWKLEFTNNAHWIDILNERKKKKTADELPLEGDQ